MSQLAWKPLVSVALAAGLLGSAATSLAQKNADRASETPIGSKWWPSRWGANDQRGAANRLTPDKVKQATQLIRTGQVYSLGRMYEYGMPLPGNRHFSLTIPGSPTGKPSGENMGVHHDELFSGEIGQIGTQFDGLGHVGCKLPDDYYFYNGFKLSEFGDAYGLKKLGVENVGPIFTRGVLIDMARYKGVDRMQSGAVITRADLEGALKAQNVRITPGDIVLLRTGHGKLWMKDNQAFGAGEPGIGMEAAQWLVEQQVVMCGADTWALEAVPHENPKRPFQVHQLLLTRNGVYVQENLDLEALAADRIYEFAYVFSPLRLKGASGSPGNPIAVR
ncbi:MAG: cyclase family protein [Armatimonadetes bacterium]|jgi:kynurenine formamidase|nr:cyclase family protein [Armatimonadota bacterium]